MIIAHVTVAEPPETVRTVREWLAWRAAEDVRMRAALELQVAEYFRGGVAQCERNMNDATQH